jgi:hypothetical protein
MRQKTSDVALVQNCESMPCSASVKDSTSPPLEFGQERFKTFRASKKPPYLIFDGGGVYDRKKAV